MSEPTIPNADKIILDLYAGGGGWSEPYAQAGYDVRRFDLLNGHDVRLLLHQKDRMHGILIASPCTHLAASGARWWKHKGESALLDSLALADAGLRAVVLYDPAWWSLENPVGRLSRFYGPPVLTFQPWEYGDPWTKRTCLWGRFQPPAKNPVEPVEGGKIHRMPPSPDRQRLRSITPPGFARAFFEANP